MYRSHLAIVSLAFLLLLAACAPTPIPPTAAPATRVPPTPVPATEAPATDQPPTAIPPTAAAATAVPPTEEPAVQGDSAAGQAVWSQNACVRCHGTSAEGARAPKLAGTALDEQEFTEIVRQGRGAMPAFAEGQISDADLRDIYAWLRSLAE